MPRKPSPKAGSLREYCAAATPEKSVEAAIRTMLELRGWRVHKIDVMRGVTVVYKKKGGGESRRRFSEGTKGQPDLLAVRPWSHRPCPNPGHSVLYIECKRPRGGKLSAAQIAAHAVLRKDGFVVIVPTSWPDAVAQAREAEIEL